MTDAMRPRPSLSAETQATLRRLERIAHTLDSAWKIPFTNKRIGVDAVADWIPGVGAVVTQAASGYIVYKAWRVGAPPALIGRMVGRLGIDTVLSVTPVLGWIGDVFYTANLSNIADLRAFLETGETRRKDPPARTR